MAKEGPFSTTVLLRWRRCALAATLVAAAGCGDSPREAPYANAKPIPRPASSVGCVPCKHSETASGLTPLPAIDGAPVTNAEPPGDEPSLLPPQALPIDAFTEWSGESAPSPEAFASGPPIPIPAVDENEYLDGSEASNDAHSSIAMALPLSAKGVAELPSALPRPSADSEPPRAVRILDILAAMRAEGEIGHSTSAGTGQRPDEPRAEEVHNAEARQLLAEASGVVTGLPTGAIVAERATAKIGRGYFLAQRGANFAARSEFLEVLRMLTEAKDQQFGARRCTVALANGLRALEEAADFASRGAEAESAANLSVIISAHRTPVAKSAECEKLLPQQLADMYFRYAQVQLGAAVAGEPAGSMALHALGKLHSQIGRIEPDKCPLADRRAFTLQQAALLARDDNQLAAHELGVLLAETGYYRESAFLLAQVAAREPHPIVFRNLARVQRKLGREQAARVSDQQAQALANRDPSAGSPVVWVAPDALARTADNVAGAPPAQANGKSPGSPTKPGTSGNGPNIRAPLSNVTRRPGGWMR